MFRFIAHLDLKHSACAIALLTVLVNAVMMQNNCHAQESAERNLPITDTDQIATADQIEMWTHLLNSEQYSDRHKATRSLMNAGTVTIPVLLNAWPNSDIEARARIRLVLKYVVSKLNFEEDSDHIGLLKSVRDSEDEQMRSMVVELIGPVPEKALVDELKSAIDMVLLGKRKGVPVSEEMLARIKSSAAFRIVRRQPLRDSDRNSPWRTIQDSEAHQEILLYRIKWFGGGGNWSGWMVAGVNDFHEQKNRQHWNCFYDHQHEYLEIMTRVGEYSNRNGYVN